MHRSWQVKPNRSLRENAQTLLPIMFDRFFAHNERVVGHPRLKGDLHAMRISGKPLRYMMEISGIAFGREFARCLNEVKSAIELMGSIHDHDVQIPGLEEYLREIRFFNRTAGRGQDRLDTGGLIILIRRWRSERGKLYSELCSLLQRWERERFRTRLIHAMGKRRASRKRHPRRRQQ